MSSSKVIFNKRFGRKHFFDKAVGWALDKALHARSARHHADNIRQMAIFSFDHIGHKINLDGVYERNELDLFFEWLKTQSPDVFNGTAVDIGANIGNHSLYMSNYFQRVVSFEPNPKTFDLLEINAREVSTIKCYRLGLSDGAGRLNFNVTSGNMGGSSISDKKEKNSIFIDVVALDSLEDQLGVVKLIKIDVEGHEVQAINGARNVILNNNPIILFEQHADDFVDQKSNVVETLKAFGYSKFAIIKPYPRQDGWANRRLAGLYAVLGRMLFGESLKMTVVDQFTPGFYSFIVAIPTERD